MATHVYVDADLCAGMAECVRIAPQAFQIDESRGVSVPLPEAGATQLDLLMTVARECPTTAVHVTVDDVELRPS